MSGTQSQDHAGKLFVRIACAVLQRRHLSGQLCMFCRAQIPLQGEGFWEWFAPGQIAPASEGYGQGLYGIYETDAAFQ
jgi:hypothetical protein